MKLSELKGERAVEVIADLIPPITNIAADAENLKLTNNKRKEGESTRDAGIRLFKERIPVLLKTHKADIVEILNVLNDGKAEEMSVIAIINSLAELGNDQEFMSLFISAVRTEAPTSPTESSADAGHSEPES